MGVWEPRGGPRMSGRPISPSMAPMRLSLTVIRQPFATRAMNPGEYAERFAAIQDGVAEGFRRSDHIATGSPRRNRTLLQTLAVIDARAARRLGALDAP